MFYKNREKFAYLISVGVHLIILLLFFFISLNLDAEPDDYVTVGFGNYGNISKPGVKGEGKPNKVITPKKVEKRVEKKEVTKPVELPSVKNEHEEKIIPEETKPENDNNVAITEKPEPIKEEKKEVSKGEEKVGEDEGSSGFEIDFGGKGIRKIYSYDLPSYPEGVSKEIDIKLKFTILPDGSVGKIIPLSMGNARLSTASINSLRKWRFEPLGDTQKQIEQTAVIIFPYRLQ